MPAPCRHGHARPRYAVRSSWHHALLSRDFVDYEIELWVGRRGSRRRPADDRYTAGQRAGAGRSELPRSRVDRAAEKYNETGAQSFFDGEIDEFAYWDRALTADGIRNLAGCHRDIGSRVVNLRADRFASPVGAGHELCVYLEAGTHDLTLVDPVADPDAQFTGWSPGPTAQWGTVFSVDPEIDAGFSFGLPVSEASGQNAYDNTVDKHTTLALSQAQHVYLSAGRACPTLRGAQLGAGRHRSLPSRRRRHFGLDFDPRCGVESGEPA